mmetsp:Transcript_26673/g.84624  ORF Transcript_26673/g.84624 Transcript_26673/m.84624 type:complete len:220 (-) Transcript_26673:26-685(-)
MGVEQHSRLVVVRVHPNPYCVDGYHCERELLELAMRGEVTPDAFAVIEVSDVVLGLDEVLTYPCLHLLGINKHAGARLLLHSPVTVVAIQAAQAEVGVYGKPALPWRLRASRRKRRIYPRRASGTARFGRRAQLIRLLPERMYRGRVVAHRCQHACIHHLPPDHYQLLDIRLRPDHCGATRRTQFEQHPSSAATPLDHGANVRFHLRPRRGGVAVKVGN